MKAVYRIIIYNDSDPDNEHFVIANNFSKALEKAKSILKQEVKDNKYGRKSIDSITRLNFLS